MIAPNTAFCALAGITRYLAVSGGISQYLAVSGGITRYLAVSGGIWRYLAVFGGIWRYLAVFVGIWRYLAVFGEYCAITPHYPPELRIVGHILVLTCDEKSENCKSHHYLGRILFTYLDKNY